jgi:DNA-3-methyladenine glycosylase II
MTSKNLPFPVRQFPYQPRRVSCFEPARIVLARDWNRTAFGQNLTEKILQLYQDIQTENCSDIVHPKIVIDGTTPYSQHVSGKQTLVIGEHRSAVRLSTEEGNTCPNYWHFSLYGFCPYGCTYCYLAGTPGVKFSPSIKIFTNIDEVLSAIDKEARKIGDITPNAILVCSVEEIQKFGISFRKAAYIRGAAQRVADGSLDIEALRSMSDTEVCNELVKLDGIGKWTAEMLMLFSMQRPDILSFGDLAILRGMRMLYRRKEIPRELFEKYRRRYSPYGSVASLYLWAIAGGDVEKTAKDK